MNYSKPGSNGRGGQGKPGNSGPLRTDTCGKKKTTSTMKVFGGKVANKTGGLHYFTSWFVNCNISQTRPHTVERLKKNLIPSDKGKNLRHYENCRTCTKNECKFAWQGITAET